MKAFMAALLLTVFASTASAATTWTTGSSEFEKQENATVEQKAKHPHSWYGGDLYHGGNQ